MNFSQNDDCVVLIGDFNARTSTNSDFVETVGDKYLANTHNTCIVNCNKNKQDPHLNNHNKNIVDLCHYLFESIFYIESEVCRMDSKSTKEITSAWKLI